MAFVMIGEWKVGPHCKENCDIGKEGERRIVDAMKTVGFIGCLAINAGGMSFLLALPR